MSSFLSVVALLTFFPKGFKRSREETIERTVKKTAPTRDGQHGSKSQLAAAALHGDRLPTASSRQACAH